MKKSLRFLGKAAVLSLVFGLVGPITASAATTPSLGVAATYAILAGTYTNTSAATTVTGDIGFTTGPAQAPLGVHTNYGSGAPTPSARIAAANTLSTGLATQPCTYTFPDTGTAIDLSADINHGPIYTPGVYCTAATRGASIGSGGITLSGSGTFIFRIEGALTSVDGSVVTLAGASPCDVFWTPIAATTLGANTTFAGTIIDNANAITIGANTNWTGQAISLGAGTVTTGSTSTITVPTCTVATTGGSAAYIAPETTINVVKIVINDNGDKKVVADFPLFVNGVSVTSGVTSVFATGTYAVTETLDPNYTQVFSGDCDASGHFDLATGDSAVCIVTNNDIGAPVIVPPVPPLIDVVKVPSPLALPDGPGAVNYTYTLKNIGTVPVTDITMVGDTCGPITLASGDADSDAKLDVNETWVYRCSTTLSETHTNTVVATGWANGLSAVDIASARVVVGVPAVVPPLIHVTKVPNPLTLLAGGGMVTYTEKVTNPGTVALSNVTLVDDKCSPMKYVSGDLNQNYKLDVDETFTFTCESKLTMTTTNTAVATGEANGLIARDFAIATVVVANAVPVLPNTGIASQGMLNIIMLVGAFALASVLFVLYMRRRSN